jgi:hypothetical protein
VVGWSVGVGGRGETCDDSSESFTDSNTPKCGGLAEDPKFDRFDTSLSQVATGCTAEQ